MPQMAVSGIVRALGSDLPAAEASFIRYLFGLVMFLPFLIRIPEALRGRFISRAVGARGRPMHRYLENFEAILRIQDHILDLADRYAVPIVDNISFDRSVLFIIRHVMESLRKREDLAAAELH